MLAHANCFSQNTVANVGKTDMLTNTLSWDKAATVYTLYCYYSDI